MITRRLQASLDQVLATSLQRLILMTLAFGAALGTSLLIAAGPGRSGAWLISLIAFAAVIVVVEPDEHLALTVIGLVVLQWLATDPEPTTARALVVAVGLFSFHSVVAMMAVTPHSATVPRPVLVRWALRTGSVLAATPVVWFLTIGFDGREIPASAPLTVAAVAALSAATFFVRHRSRVDPADLGG